MSVSVEQAASNALAAWLTTNLTGSPAVEPRWADPTKLFSGGATAQHPIALAILFAGPPVDDYHDDISGSTFITSGRRLRHQPLTLEVWAAYDVDRDDLVAQLDTLLAGRGGPSTDATTAAELGVIDHGVVLTLADGYSPASAGFVFGVPVIADSKDNVGRSLYRATYAGFSNSLVSIP